MRRYPLIERLWACNRVRRVAWRVGRLDARRKLGDVSLAALRAVRAKAIAVDCIADDVDDVTIEGVEQGRSS